MRAMAEALDKIAGSLVRGYAAKSGQSDEEIAAMMAAESWFTAAEAVELGNRMWRKKVLPVGDVEYKGRTLHFTRDYLGRLVRAFQDRAYDQVPFQLADAQNTHTNDPERTRGEITGMDLGDDGLYVTAQLTPEGEAVLTANPKLGVSARIVEGYDRSDGKFFGAAIQHVLGTLDPRIPGLGPWQAIEAANPEADTVIDLSGESFAAPSKTARKAVKAQRKAAKQQDNTAGNGADLEGGADMADLTADQKARLDKLLALPDDVLDALAAGGTVVTPEELAALADPDGTEGEDSEEDEGDALAEEIAALSDEELAAIEAEFEAEARNTPAEPGFRPNYMPEGEPVTAGLTAEAQFAIDMANARADETARDLAVVTARLREEDYQAEKRRLADLGVPPYLTDLAKPLLEGAGHAVELANGKTVDAGAIVRKVLTEYARQVKLLDLGAELGTPMDEPEDAGREEAVRSRDDVIARAKTAMGIR
jgi:hypothetical protein